MKHAARIAIIGEDTAETSTLEAELTRHGFLCSSRQTDGGDLNDIDLAVLDISPFRSSNSHVDALLKNLKRKKVPSIALVREGMLDALPSQPEIDDFIIKPWKIAELVIRVQRTLSRAGKLNSKIIICGDLRIDSEKCEVSLVGELLDLTFKEYELLKFLAANKGRVFTRDALLKDVWGYDYYGGERTVDVHIRRLRSKIEDIDHVFIDTVRNIGYKFDDFSSKNSEQR